jgi:hypothetical protein
MWEPLRLTTLWASTACYRDSFTFLPLREGIVRNFRRKREGRKEKENKKNEEEESRKEE